MRHNHSKLLYFAALILGLFFSCKKQSSLNEPGNALIYMPTSVNGVYNVPMSGSTAGSVNYIIDTVNGGVNIPLSVYLSGRQESDAFAVDVKVVTDTVTQLVKAGTLQGVAILSSTSCTVNNKVGINKGQNHAIFQVSINLDTLKKYAGAKVAFAVNVSNPTKYELNGDITTTIVVLDVDPVLYGPLLTLTSKYIKNAGPIFDITTGSPPKGQCDENQQTPTDWHVNDAVKIFAYNGKIYGGVDARCYGNRDYLSCNNYAYYTTTSILNGKISQTFTLPKGKYVISDDLADAIGGVGHAFMTIAKGDTLPDFTNVPAQSIQSTDMALGTSISFVLNEDTKVTFGFVYNFNVGEQCSFAIRSVTMIGRVGGN